VAIEIVPSAEPYTLVPPVTVIFVARFAIVNVAAVDSPLG
jgi:hypothetical protein